MLVFGEVIPEVGQNNEVYGLTFSNNQFAEVWKWTRPLSEAELYGISGPPALSADGNTAYVSFTDRVGFITNVLYAIDMTDGGNVWLTPYKGEGYINASATFESAPVIGTTERIYYVSGQWVDGVVNAGTVGNALFHEPIVGGKIFDTTPHASAVIVNGALIHPGQNNKLIITE